ncbi:MAG: hypothetical protein U9R44_02790 [Candidatus Omnitrophota bacterium]|nr:hypothetical protein [Candidatus Omnitrophota bacterium]
MSKITVRFRQVFPALLFVSVMLFRMCVAAPADVHAAGEDFFSPGRFSLDRRAIKRIPGDGKTKRDINDFAKNYTAGMEKLSSGDLAGAREDLLKARDFWPEYFGTDFLLALVHEKEGDYRTAARYYKSYLNKLKRFHEGQYPISGQLIRIFLSFNIEKYDTARELVKEHLLRYDILLDNVRPAFALPWFLLPITFVALLGVVYVTFFYWLWPFVKRQQRLRHPPEGFWICRHCDRANPELSKVCERCRRPRE